jgi:hypothetical protein
MVDRYDADITRGNTGCLYFTYDLTATINSYYNGSPATPASSLTSITYYYNAVSSNAYYVEY